MKRRNFLKYSSLFALTQLVGYPVGLPKSFALSGKWYERAEPLMGSILSIAVFHDNQLIANQLIDQCFSYLKELLARISDWEPNSETSKLNNNHYLKNSSLNAELRNLLTVAEDIKTASNGSFNILSGALTNLWQDAYNKKNIPGKKDLEKACAEVRDSNLKLANQELSISGLSPIELGGIGKGFVADCAAEFLKTKDIKFARVAASGDLRFIGDTNWKVDIEHPRAESFLGQLSLFGNCAVSTSGDYQTCWNYQSKKYHHLIDLVTGRPAEHCISATIVTQEGVYADALATAAFIMPIKKSLEMISSLPDVAAVLVDQQGKIYQSKNIDFKSS